MAWYRDHVLPRLQGRVMDQAAFVPVRRRVCSGLSGEVLEVGFGTGLNLAYYPAEVAKVWVVEPSQLCLRLAAPRLGACPVPLELAGSRADQLELASGQVDTIVSTWTLCTVPDLQAALGELRRVLKPGGRLVFAEHGRAPDQAVERWQLRLTPLQRRLAGGCELARRIPQEIEAAGFSLGALSCYYLSGVPKVFGYTFEGWATPV
jgi:ubiquinone/menaquinone biosynthesis C-methylase UbiE